MTWQMLRSPLLVFSKIVLTLVVSLSASLITLLSAPDAVAGGAPQVFPEIPSEPEAEPPKAPEVKLNPNSLDLLRKQVGFEAYRANMQAILAGAPPTQRKIKVAILDKGFSDWESRQGRTLPRHTKYYPGPQPSQNVSPHGTLMGEIVTSLVAGAEWQAPNMDAVPFDLYLINVGGFTNFRAAIQTVLDEKIDVVLYSEIWELGGNGDGRGFINLEVTKAVQAGVLWINASGNFNGRVWNGPIQFAGDQANDDLVTLPDSGRSLQIVCQPPQGETDCLMKITLSWNDFQDDWQRGTLKDLDLALADSDRKPVQISRQKQVDIDGEAGMGESKYPRETVAAQVKAGTYSLFVRSKQRNWNENDRIRILIDGDSLYFPRGSNFESLQNPADNSQVITVGGSDSVRSSVSLSLQKPELVVRSSMMERFGKEFRGSSNAAAVVAAGIVLLKFENPSLNREQAIRALSADVFRGESEWGWGQLGLMDPPGCLATRATPTGILAIDQILAGGGRWVETPLGPKILIGHPVAELKPGLSVDPRAQSLWIGDKGFVALPRGEWSSDLAQSVEVLQRPQGTELCEEYWAPRQFRLPIQ